MATLPLVTVEFTNKSKLSFNTTKINESSNAYHCNNIVFPFKYIRDMVVKDPDNILQLEIA